MIHYPGATRNIVDQAAQGCTSASPFVAPCHSFLLERTPKEGPSETRIWRKDEYPD
jgi:hypothetical protein